MTIAATFLYSSITVPDSLDKTLTNRALDALAGEYDTSNLELMDVSGGYSRNRRAIVSVGKEEMFLKEVDTSLLPDEGVLELGWLKKDHDVIEALRSMVPSLVPEWSKLTMNGHLLILPSYSKNKGWLWAPPEDVAMRTLYIERVVSATRWLEKLELQAEITESLLLQPFFRDELAHDDSIARILSDDKLRSRLIYKYSKRPRANLETAYSIVVDTLGNDSALLDLQAQIKQLADQPNDCFNHCDVRSDNIAYNPATNEVKFVDWNWASYAPSKFGSTEFLVDMARRGIDVRQWTGDLNVQLLAAMVGLYLVKGLKEPLSSTSTLRDMQAESGAIALQLYYMTLQA